MIQLNNIHKSFNDVEVIKGIDLSVGKGEVVTLIGRSGSGKTTLLRMINALEIPTEGTVYVNGKTYTSKDKKSQIEVRKQSGMVFQSYNLFPHKTALENVMEGLITVKKLKKDEARGKSLELLEKVGLTHVKDQRPHALSGGQQQRVAIARAIVNRPTVLIADEPTGNLDPDTSKDIVELFKHINNFGTTVIMVTHNMDLVSYLNKRVIRLKDGRVQSDNMRGAEINEA